MGFYLNTLLVSLAIATAGSSNANSLESGLTVSAEGRVTSAGTLTLPVNSRLADLIIAAQPRADAYLLGSTFTRKGALAPQRRLKAGLLYDLHALESINDPDVQQLAPRLSEWIEDRAVTGRVRHRTDARLMQAQPMSNPQLQAADALYIPARPATITVTGAVQQECVLTHVPLKPARQYAAECARHAAADKGNLFVIQADGAIQQLSVEAWNRSEPQAVSPGGTVFVPLTSKALANIDANFNQEFAEFIATQFVNP